MDVCPLLWFLLLLAMCLSGSEVALSKHPPIMECNTSDREALLDLKHGIEDPWRKLSSWQGNNCCQWWGITCDNTSGAVVAIDFNNPLGSGSSDGSEIWNLGGEIRPSLAKLKSLRYLDLSFNTFNVSFPPFFFSLEKLQYLNLSSAYFRGKIPPTLGNLSCLQFLDLSYLNVTVDSFEWVSGLVSLKYVAMTQVPLPEGWAEELNKLPFITEIHFSHCYLTRVVSSLPAVNFSSLRVLDLSNNFFDSKLPNWVVNISSLEFLDLSFCLFYGWISLRFSELPNLQSLKLSGNIDLRASCSQFIKGSWKQIRHLDLATTEVRGRIPASLGNLTSLVYLDLSDNTISGSIPSSIGRLCNLQYVDFSFNNLTGGLPGLLDGIDDCPHKRPLPDLQYFACKTSQLTGDFPDWLGDLQNLIAVDLSYNLLEGPIRNSFGSSKHLSKLILAYNKLNGSLPSNLGLLSELTELDVSANQLSDNISEAHFSGLSKLQRLTLFGNSFILNTSFDWVPPFQVSYLHMGSCHLGPSFPAWLRSQKEMTYVDISNSSISGSIPSWFWDIAAYLSVLNVSNNHLEGHLPNPLNVGPDAIVDFSFNFFQGPIPLPKIGIAALDLSNNQFFGHIPDNFGELMAKLVFLSLSSNQLIGEIPTSFGNMSLVEVINLSVNNLTGSIPSSIGKCSNLNVLDLQSNHLNGSIPVSLSLLQLQTLHLSNNQLSGKIPSAFQYLNSLETLDLRNNKLTGRIPIWSDYAFPSLRILSLRSNKFFGKLPTRLSNLGFLQVLDLAENNLSGTVPTNFFDFQALVQEQNENFRFLYGGFWLFGVDINHYYEEKIVVNLKGQPLEYTKTLSLLTSIDLSENNLSGELPEGLTNLAGLLVLNLSGNHFSGQIPPNISEMRNLLSLDLSNNMLSGPVPQSMCSLTFLGTLNLSNNNLSGIIPTANQMSTFTPASFAGNPGLSGYPLDMTHRRDNPNNPTGNNVDSDSRTKDEGNDKWFYFSIGLGFAAGLLLPFIVFAIKISWGDAYFHFVDIIVRILLSRINGRLPPRIMSRS